MKRIVLATAVMAALPTAAASAESDKKIPMMDEVVVSATKTVEKRKEVANPVLIRDGFDLSESPATSLGEFLGGEPGVDWRTRGDYAGAAEEIRLRGMDAKATQVLVNGLRINSPSLGTADISTVPTNNIERIEVVKGAGSLLYGSGAMAGTVSIITKEPERDRIDAKISAGYGSGDTYEISVEQGMFVTDYFGYYLTAGRKESDGFRDNSDLTHNDVSLKLLYEPANDYRVTFYGDFIDREFGLPGVKPVAGTKDYYRPNGEKFYSSEAASLQGRGADEDAHLILEARGQITPWLAVTLEGSYVALENYYKDRYPSSGTGVKTWVTNRVLGGEVNVELKSDDNATLLVGMEYSDFSWENENKSLDANGNEVAGGYTAAKAGLFTTGTFAELQLKATDYIKGVVGIRHEDHSTFGSETLPLFGLVVTPLKNTVIKATHGKHFLAPTPNDLFWPADMWTKGNSALKPETGWHSDVTVEQSLKDDRVFLSGSYFHWKVTDKIQWAMDSMFIYTPQNLDGYRADGVELTAALRPVDTLSIRLSYTMTDAEEQNGTVWRRSAYAPKQQARADITYWSDTGATVTATTRYVGDRNYYSGSNTTATPSQILDAYMTTDLKIETRFRDHWLLGFQVNNIFDKGYDTYYAFFYNEAFAKVPGTYAGVGRTYFVTAGFEY